MLRRQLLLGALVLLPLFGGCTNNSQTSENSSQVASSASKSEIIMGLIPAEDNEEMLAKFEPMRAHLEEKIGMPVKVFQATDYAGVIEAMKRDRVDIAWFGPLSYVLAEQEAEAEAFAVGVKEGGTSTYQSMIFVPGDSPAKSIADLKGTDVAFVDPASTSGSLVPSYMVKKSTGQMPDQFFGKVTYAGSHDAAQLAVKNKTVAAAGSNDITHEKMLEKGLIKDNDLRILETSDPIPGSPLTYRADLDPEMKAKIKEVILNAHNEIEVTGYGTLARYEEVTAQDYQVIRDIVQQLGLQKEEILK